MLVGGGGEYGGGLWAVVVPVVLVGAGGWWRRLCADQGFGLIGHARACELFSRSVLLHAVQHRRMGSGVTFARNGSTKAH